MWSSPQPTARRSPLFAGRRPHVGSATPSVEPSRVPGSLANIDHVAIGPRGIFVIDAKHYAGKIEKRDVGGWVRRDERLFVRGRDRTKLAEAMERQVDVVSRAVGSAEPPVCITPVLCFVDAECHCSDAR